MKKKYIAALLLTILLIVLSLLINTMSDSSIERSFENYYENLPGSADPSKSVGWDNYISKSRFKIVKTNKNLYTFLREQNKYPEIIDADVFQLKRDHAFNFVWDIEELSSSTVKKTFDEVIVLAKTTDIGKINRKVVDSDIGDDCYELEGQPGMWNCRKKREDEGYDPNISTYRALTKKESEIQEEKKKSTDVWKEKMKQEALDALKDMEKSEMM